MVTAFILPNYPHTTKWLTQEERAFAAWRLAQDINEADTYGEQTVWGGVKMIVRDYRLYVFVLIQHVSLISQTFQYFFPTIVGTLGYGRIVTLWLTAPAWVRNGWHHVSTLFIDCRIVCYFPPLHLCNLELGKDKRQILTHCLSHAAGSRRKCNCCWHHCCWSTLLCHVSHANGRCVLL